MAFFKESERKVWRPSWSPETPFDPLVVDRQLTIISGGRLDAWVSTVNAAGSDEGDVNPESRKKLAVEAAEAELELAKVSRSVFSLPAFPETTDAVALEHLYEFLDYLEGKGVPGKARQPSPGYSPEASYAGATTSTLNST